MKLFDSLYDGAKELIKGLKKPLAERALKRKYEQARDEAQKRVDDAELTMQNEKEKLCDLDFNVLIKATLEIEQAMKVDAIIRLQYKEMFGEEMA